MPRAALIGRKDRAKGRRRREERQSSFTLFRGLSTSLAFTARAFTIRTL
jgi:hypothetical protein